MKQLRRRIARNEGWGKALSFTQDAIRRADRHENCFDGHHEYFAGSLYVYKAFVDGKKI